MFKMILSLILTTLWLLITTFIPNSAKVTYSDIMGCEKVCDVVATGYPLAFIVDYPGLSPVDSADLMGLLMGWDKLIWFNLFVLMYFWLIVSLFMVNLFWKSTYKTSKNRGGVLYK